MLPKTAEPTCREEAEVLCCIPRQKRSYLFCKRVFDIGAALFAIVVSAPLMLIIAILIKISDGGPVFFRQTRIGRGGVPILILKFRSMRVGAACLEESLTEAQLVEYRREYKVANDPRITRLGRFLRRTSLDELPQVFHVLRGTLSLIGPRPILEEEFVHYTAAERAKFQSVKPGLTGYWQAYARNNATYESGERQRMEMYYVDHASVWLDVRILFRTLIAVIRKDGSQ